MSETTARLGDVREALTHDIEPQQRPFVGNGMGVVPYLDPDGYRSEFESPTDEPGPGTGV